MYKITINYMTIVQDLFIQVAKVIINQSSLQALCIDSSGNIEYAILFYIFCLSKLYRHHKVGYDSSNNLQTNERETHSIKELLQRHSVLHKI